MARSAPGAARAPPMFSGHILPSVVVDAKRSPPVASSAGEHYERLWRGHALTMVCIGRPAGTLLFAAPCPLPVVIVGCARGALQCKSAALWSLAGHLLLC